MHLSDIQVLLGPVIILEDICLDPKAEILDAYGSDNDIVSLSCLKSTQQRQGIQQPNNALLENPDLTKMIRDINNSYSGNIHSPRIWFGFYNASNIEYLQLSITVTLFLETHLCQVGGLIIKVSKSMKKNENEGLSMQILRNYKMILIQVTTQKKHRLS